jgi:hypothetical protein
MPRSSRCPTGPRPVDLFMAEDVERWNPLVQKLGISID